MKNSKILGINSSVQQQITIQFFALLFVMLKKGEIITAEKLKEIMYAMIKKGIEKSAHLASILDHIPSELLSVLPSELLTVIIPQKLESIEETSSAVHDCENCSKKGNCPIEEEVKEMKATEGQDEEKHKELLEEKERQYKELEKQLDIFLEKEMETLLNPTIAEI